MATTRAMCCHPRARVVRDDAAVPRQRSSAVFHAEYNVAPPRQHVRLPEAMLHDPHPSPGCAKAFTAPESPPPHPPLPGPVREGGHVACGIPRDVLDPAFANAGRFICQVRASDEARVLILRALAGSAWPNMWRPVQCCLHRRAAWGGPTSAPATGLSGGTSSVPIDEAF